MSVLYAYHCEEPSGGEEPSKAIRSADVVPSAGDGVAPLAVTGA
ncbi:MAG: hypothetical protein NZT92_18660 [Abditibacteriales bacterium]|nr:hypothetical protein [Abditibacteriales bacterium]MDW8367543.1 hypothetical protein [Abditibacteriales bacterium]